VVVFLISSPIAIVSSVKFVRLNACLPRRVLVRCDGFVDKRDLAAHSRYLRGLIIAKKARIALVVDVIVALIIFPADARERHNIALAAVVVEPQHPVRIGIKLSHFLADDFIPSISPA